VRSRLLALVVAVALIGGGVALRSRRNAGSSTSPVDSTSSGGHASGKTIDLLCAREAEALCRDAVDSFNAKKPKVAVSLSLGDSSQAALDIGGGKARPLLWLASSAQFFSLANAGARDRGSREAVATGAGDVVAVASTPIVLGVWSDRAAVLSAHCASVGVRCVHDAAGESGWKAIGGQEAWGPVKLTFADALRAADGLLTLAAIADTFADRADAESTVLDDPRFHDFVRDLEKARTALPGDDIAAAFVANGPARADAVFSFESSLAAQLDNGKRRYPPDGLKLFYPERLIVADISLATLVDDTTPSDERSAAIQFRDQMARSAAGLAAAHGFRSAGAGNAAGGALAAHAAEGVLPDLASSSPVPEPAMLDGLQRLWKEVTG